MLVYRLCKEEEINTILKTKDFSSVGRKFQNNNNLNTHEYQKDKRYLHFFLKEYQITYLNPKPDRYICTYNIPKEIVLPRIYRGYYKSSVDYTKLETTAECAIETDLLDFCYLVKVERPTRYLDLEDYLGEIENYKEVVYGKNTKTKTKKL